MADVTNDLVYEVLKNIQDDISEMKEVQSDHGQKFIRIRQDINVVRGEKLRLERMVMQTDQRLDRIEHHLGSTDA